MRFITITVLCAASLYGGTAESIAGRWEGQVQIPGQEIRLVVDLAPDGDGKWTGSAIAPGFGVKGAWLAEITVAPPEVAFVIKGALGDPHLKGRMTADGEIGGEYQQGGHTARFLLRRAGVAQVEAQPRSTPVSKELAGEWRGEFSLMGNKLRARLVLENGSAGGTAKFVVIGRRENNFPVDLLTQDGELILVESHETQATFEGRFHRETGEIAGTFTQGPFEAALVLHPAAKEAKEARP